MWGTRECECGVRVLVVEDDRDLSRLMAAHLASEGYDVARARETATALELVGFLQIILLRVKSHSFLLFSFQRQRFLLMTH